MRQLSRAEIQHVAGGGIVGDSAACVGGVVAIGATDGVAAIFGVGIATIGACYEAGMDWGAVLSTDTVASLQASQISI
jgi:hypothetical protein